jgi:hypothetical protein
MLTNANRRNSNRHDRRRNGNAQRVAAHAVYVREERVREEAREQASVQAGIEGTWRMLAAYGYLHTNADEFVSFLESLEWAA